MNRLWRVLSSLIAGLVVYSLLGTAPISPEARCLAAILICTIGWWVSEAMPLAVSGLFASVLCILMQVAPAREVMAPYADPVIFLFLGSFWIAQAMSVHGLDQRIALKLLSWPALSKTPRRLLIGFGFAACLISMTVSNTATTAMLLPIVLGTLQSLPDSSRHSTLQCRALLMLSFAASIGGLGTPIGTPPNLIGIGMLERLTGIHVSFLGWMKLALPLVGLSMLFCIFLLGWDLEEPMDWGNLRKHLKRETSRMGKMTRAELNTLAVLGIAVLLWVAGGKKVPEGVAALLAAGLLFILPAEDGEATLNWEQACKIDWGTLLLFGSGMSLGQLLFQTKLAEEMGKFLVTTLGISSPGSISGVSIALALITSELASNTASANVAVPTALALAHTVGSSPILPALSATLAASFGFLLPVSTPPNALVYGTGKIPLKEMLRYGLILDIFGFFLIWWGLQMSMGRL